MDDTADAPLAARVVGGGEPTAEELAAVLLALTPVVVGDDGKPEAAGAAVPAWTRAAMLEGVGGRPSASPTDLATALPLR